jgi:transketolase
VLREPEPITADAAAIQRLAVTTIRTLAMDAVQQAGSGHPGTPMAMAPVAYALWQRHTELLQMQRRELPDGWDRDLPVFEADLKGVSGRDASARVLNAIAPRVPWLVGGAADLAPSTKTRLTFDGAGDFSADDRAGRNLHPSRTCRRSSDSRRRRSSPPRATSSKENPTWQSPPAPGR